MKLRNIMDSNRFSESNQRYLQEYKQAKDVSKKKEIIKKMIANEKTCLQENIDFFWGMRNVNNTKSTRVFLFLLLVAPAAIVAGYFVFTFLVAVSIISVPIFAALCFWSAFISVKEAGYSQIELNKQKKICSDKIQLIGELKAALQRLELISEETMENSSSSEKLDGKKSNVCFFQPARQENEESKSTYANNLITSVSVLGFK